MYYGLLESGRKRSQQPMYAPPMMDLYRKLLSSVRSASCQVAHQHATMALTPQLIAHIPTKQSQNTEDQAELHLVAVLPPGEARTEGCNLFMDLRWPLIGCTPTDVGTGEASSHCPNFIERTLRRWDEICRDTNLDVDADSTCQKIYAVVFQPADFTLPLGNAQMPIPRMVRCSSIHHVDGSSQNTGYRPLGYPPSMAFHGTVDGHDAADDAVHEVASDSCREQPTTLVVSSAWVLHSLFFREWCAERDFIHPSVMHMAVSEDGLGHLLHQPLSFNQDFLPNELPPPSFRDTYCSILTAVQRYEDQGNICAKKDGETEEMAGTRGRRMEGMMDPFEGTTPRRCDALRQFGWQEWQQICRRGWRWFHELGGVPATPAVAPHLEAVKMELDRLFVEHLRREVVSPSRDTDTSNEAVLHPRRAALCVAKQAASLALRNVSLPPPSSMEVDVECPSQSGRNRLWSDLQRAGRWPAAAPLSLNEAWLRWGVQAPLIVPRRADNSILASVADRLISLECTELGDVYDVLWDPLMDAGVEDEPTDWPALDAGEDNEVLAALANAASTLVGASPNTATKKDVKDDAVVAAPIEEESEEELMEMMKLVIASHEQQLERLFDELTALAKEDVGGTDAAMCCAVTHVVEPSGGPAAAHAHLARLDELWEVMAAEVHTMREERSRHSHNSTAEGPLPSRRGPLSVERLNVQELQKIFLHYIREDAHDEDAPACAEVAMKMNEEGSHWIKHAMIAWTCRDSSTTQTAISPEQQYRLEVQQLESVRSSAPDAGASIQQPQLHCLRGGIAHHRYLEAALSLTYTAMQRRIRTIT